jgi:glutamate/tyrosine decarboxylase-like PLP-dependent enzyme/acyl carrier protein
LAPGTDLTAEVRATLGQWTCELLRIPDRDLDAESELTQYGLDSISSVQLVNRINKTYGIELRPTTLFEHPTLAGFAQYLVDDHGDALAARHHRSNGAPARAEVRNEVVPATGQASLSEILTSSRSRRNATAVQLQASLASEAAQHPPKSSFNGAPFTFGRRQRPESPPLSYMQERLLFMHQRENVGSAYHLPMSFRLVGSLDTAALRASFTELVRRHESLRTRFFSADDGAVQVIEPSVAVELPIVDLQHLTEDERPDEARRLSTEWLRRPFDLEVAPLIRVGAIRLRPTEHMLVIVAHHLVTDGWSMELLIREVSALYSAFSRGLPSPLQNVPAQYADYCIWQRQQVQERFLDRELSYWTDRLVDAPVLELPTDRPRPPAPSYRGSTVLFSFPGRDVAALRGLAQREGVSLFTVLFAAFNIVLFRWSGQDDIVVGTPVAGRRLLEFENSIGFFTNWLALRNDLSGEPTFRELLQRVKNTSLGAFAHQDLPLPRIEAEIKSMRDLSRHPLFRVLLGLQRVSPGAAFTGLDASPVYIENNTSRRDLCFFLYETPDGLFGVFEYATDLFDASTIERMVGEFRAVLYQMLADPDAGIGSPQPLNIADIEATFVPDEPTTNTRTSLDPSDWNRFRGQGHRMLDDMLDYLERIRERPVWQPIPDDVRARFREPLPVKSTDLAIVHDEFMQSILPFATGNSHPAVMGRVHGGGNPDGMLAEMLAAGLNADLGGRDHAPMEVEKQIVQWARELFGFPEGATGLFVTGTSMATMIAQLVARHAAIGADVRHAGVAAGGGRLTAYTSAAAHGCIAQAMDLAGIGTDALRQIPTDKRHAIHIALLEQVIADDRKLGLRPFLIVGTAGTADIGAIDDLKALAAIAKREGAWFHIDGAFGALGMLAPEIAPRLAGMDEADSLAFDFHKWGQVPYDAGAILVRDGAQHRAAFAPPAAHLRQETWGLAGGSPGFCDFGPDLSRGFKALKTWFTIKVHGAARIGAVISRTCELAQSMRRQIESCPDLELLAPVQLNIVCFRYRCADPDPVNAAIVADLHESGIAAPSTTVLDGQIAIRAAIVNHRTEACDVDAVLAAIIKFGKARTEARSYVASETYPPEAAQ